MIGGFASWLTHQSALTQLRAQFIERGKIVTVSIRELAALARTSQQAAAGGLQHAIEDIVKVEPSVLAVTLQTTSPRVIIGSSLHGGLNINDPVVGDLLTDINHAIDTGTFGYYFNEYDSLVTMLPIRPADAPHDALILPKTSRQNDRHGEDQIYDQDDYQGVVRVQMDWGSIVESSSLVLIYAGLSTALNVLAILLLASVLVFYYVLRPMSRLQSVLSLQEKGDHAARAPELANDEIGRAAQALNTLLDTLNDRDFQFRSFVDNAPTSILMKDHLGRYLIANQQWQSLYNPDNQDITGKTAFDFHDREKAQKITDQDNEVMASGQPMIIENSSSSADGVFRTSLVHKFPIFDASQKITGLGAFVADITQRKAEEIELQSYRKSLEQVIEKRQQEIADRTQELEEANKKLEVEFERSRSANIAKSNFLATMSHEIRTPLNGVLGIAQLLATSELDEDQRQKVNTILSSGNTLLSIISDVLDMSRIEAGGMELEETAFNLQDLTTTITSPFQSLAQEKGLQLQVINQIESSRSLIGDPVRLRQVLWNLLSNAIKFTHEGHVRLEIAAAEAETGQKSDQRDCLIRFTISDTGVGISEDRAKAIFDPFTQADNSITRRFGGTGLGLSIVKQLTEMMGGHVDVESQPGKGTTFHVHFPFYLAEASASNSQSADAERTTKVPCLNVLVAEDNDVNAIIAEAFVKKAGHQVRRVTNGREAVDVAKENWADVILMDVHMPEMNGIDATKTIRSSETDRRIPIIGLTAEAFAERHIQFIDAGMDTVITKPFAEQQLVNALIKFAGPSQQAGRAPTEDRPVAPSEDAVTAEVPPIGDAERLDRLRQQMTHTVLNGVLEEAIRSLERLLETLRNGAEQDDREIILSTAHSIKGACGSLFGMRISALAMQLEDRSRPLEQVRQLMPEFEKTATETIEWWRGQIR